MQIRELDIPVDVAEWDDSDEICRVWIGNGDSAVSLRMLFGEDYQSWGMVLADLAMQIGNAAKMGSGAKLEDVLAGIEAGYRGRLAEKFDMSGRFLTNQH